MNAGFLARGTGCLTVPGLGQRKGSRLAGGKGRMMRDSAGCRAEGMPSAGEGWR